MIESLKISKDEYWILSTSALVIRDLFEDAGNLDIAVTKKGLDELNKNYNLIQKDNGWYIVSDKIECVLDTKDDYKVEQYGEYNLESIQKYYEYLKSSNRDKDKLKLQIVEEYISKIEKKK